MGSLALAGCGRAPAPAPAVGVTAMPVAALPLDPRAAEWTQAPEFVAKLLLQDMVEPRKLEPTTPAVRVRALVAGRAVAFRLEWTDATADDVSAGARFPDACAVQLPARTEPDVPAPQMGETGRPVEIAFWRASWQATVDGREDSIKTLYPNASIDHYPFEAASLADDAAARAAMADRYAPARALGNTMAGPRQSPVQDLIAEGPGTLTPAAVTHSRGMGRQTAEGWSVVIARPLPADLGVGQRSQVAFAVWQGSADEVGARKMRTGWVTLAIGGAM